MLLCYVVDTSADLVDSYGPVSVKLPRRMGKQTTIKHKGQAVCILCGICSIPKVHLIDVGLLQS